MHDLKLDHLTIAAPSLAEGVAYIEATLGVSVPFGTRHAEMATHNHRLRIGPDIYLEVIAPDTGEAPAHCRWFDLDETAALRKTWSDGVRLRHWTVTRTDAGPSSARDDGFGPMVQVGRARFFVQPSLADTLRLAWPCLIDRQGAPSPVERMTGLGVTLLKFVIEHPFPGRVAELYRSLSVARAPVVRPGPVPRYIATFSTPTGTRVLL